MDINYLVDFLKRECNVVLDKENLHIAERLIAYENDFNIYRLESNNREATIYRSIESEENVNEYRLLGNNDSRINLLPQFQYCLIFFLGGVQGSSGFPLGVKLGLPSVKESTLLSRRKERLIP